MKKEIETETGKETIFEKEPKEEPKEKKEHKVVTYKKAINRQGEEVEVEAIVEYTTLEELEKQKVDIENDYQNKIKEIDNLIRQING